MIRDHLRAALIIITLLLTSPLLVPRASVEGQPAAKVSTSPAPAPSPLPKQQITPVTTTQSPSAAVNETPTATPTAMPTAGEPELTFLSDEGSQPAAEQSGLLGLITRTLGALLLIIGLVVAGAWLVRRFSSAHFNPSRENVPELSVLTTVALGDRRTLTVVRFGDKTFLLGSTAQAITVLAVETPENALYDYPLRSVADMLNGVDTPSFDYEMTHARRALNQNFDQRPSQEQGLWREDGGEV